MAHSSHLPILLKTSLADFQLHAHKWKLNTEQVWILRSQDSETEV